MASTPSKIPTVGSKARQVRDSKSATPISRDPRRETPAGVSKKRESATPLKGEVRKARATPGGSASSSPRTAVSSPSLGAKTAPGNLESECADLRKENASLKKELEELKLLHSQLVQEGPTERFAEKRVNLLKTQIVQLERQVVLLTQALSSRTELMLDLQVMLESLNETLRDSVKEEGQGEVLKMASTMNERLNKHNQESSLDSLAQPLQFLDDFVRTKKSSSMADDAPKSATVLDVCSGQTDHINLKQVNRLESKLVDLFGELTQLQNSLEVTGLGRSPSLLRPMEDRLTCHVTQSFKLIGECCQSLLCFSLLVPSAPSPPLKSTENVTLEFNASSVLKRLPAALRNKKEVREVIESATTAMSHHSKLNETKCRVLGEELQFHKAVYDLQISYIGSLFKAVREGYETFEASVQETLCSPLNELLQGYSNLSQTASDQALKDFLEILQKNHKQLEEALESFSTTSTQNEASNSKEPQGAETLSLYGQHFFEQLSELEARCDRARQADLATN